MAIGEVGENRDQRCALFCKAPQTNQLQQIRRKRRTAHNGGLSKMLEGASHAEVPPYRGLLIEGGPLRNLQALLVPA